VAEIAAVIQKDRPSPATAAVAPIDGRRWPLREAARLRVLAPALAGLSVLAATVGVMLRRTVLTLRALPAAAALRPLRNAARALVELWGQTVLGVCASVRGRGIINCNEANEAAAAAALGWDLDARA
jgi:hypothetical protein